MRLVVSCRRLPMPDTRFGCGHRRGHEQELAIDRLLEDQLVCDMHLHNAIRVRRGEV